MNPSKQTPGQPVEVPADFPSFDHTGVLAGDHPRSTLVKYEDKYYERGSTPPEVRVDYEMCEDLAHQVMVQCQRKLAQGDITRDAVLELALDRLRDKPWCTLPQNVWVLRRAAALLAWEVPASIPAAPPVVRRDRI